MTRAFSMSLAVAMGALASPCLAQPSPEDVAAAQALFDEAKRMIDNGQAAAACPKLEKSLRLDVGIGTRYHLARCYELTRRTASAWSQYLEVAAASQAAGQFEREAVARQLAQSLEPRLSRLTVIVPQEARVRGLVVRRNGLELGSAQWDLPVPVDIGVYTVSAEAPGRQPWQFEVPIQEDGASAELAIPVLAPLAAPLVAAPPPEPLPAGLLTVPAPRQAELEAPRSTPWQWAGIATAGVGAAGLGVSGVFALVAADKDRDSGCNDGSCPTQHGETLNQSARQYGDFATATFVFGALLVGGGAVLYLAPPDRQTHGATAASLSPRITVSGTGLALDGGFW
jgi:hypothetical protein